MNWKKKLLKKSRLYVIIDKGCLNNKSLPKIASLAQDAGAGIIQLRDKISGKDTVLETALATRKIISHKKAAFIANDYLDIAKISDADGIHLGQDDIPVAIARKIMGKNKIIGVSCHSLAQAIKAKNNGADYISLGPIFPTSTKPEYKPVGLNLIKKVTRKINIPIFAIGGITENNIRQVLSCKVKRAAVCSAICKTKDIRKTIKSFIKIIPA